MQTCFLLVIKGTKITLVSFPLSHDIYSQNFEAQNFDWLRRIIYCYTLHVKNPLVQICK